MRFLPGKWKQRRGFSALPWPFLFFILLLSLILVAPSLSLRLKEGLYALSLSCKSLMMFLLPWIIFGLLFKTTLHLAHQATRIIALILIGVCVSTLLSLSLSYGIGLFVYTQDLSLHMPENLSGLVPLWDYPLHSLIPNHVALLSGFVSGLGCFFFWPKRADQISAIVDRITVFLLKIVLCLVPFFILGSLLKIQHEGMLSLMVHHYPFIFSMIVLTQWGYLFLLFFILAKGQIGSCLGYLKHLWPAALSGLCTMSSAASMPLTIQGSSQNVRNPELSASIIPATVNIHLIGDCIATPLLAFALLKSFGMDAPSLMQYGLFALYFIAAKFSVAAIPGGGIIVMLPVLEHILGFNPAMLSLITALYLLFDPLITSTNILGNGAFAQYMDRLLWKEPKRPTE